MAGTKGTKLAEVVQAVEALKRNNMPVNVAAVLRILGGRSRQGVKRLLRLVMEPECQRISKIEAEDRLVTRLLSENATMNAGVPGQLVELLDEVNGLQEQVDATFDRAVRVMSLMQTVMLENINTISELSSVQETLKRELAELRYILNNRENPEDPT
ncbi:MAG: hypothetical protein I8H81_01430 [Pseudomonadales bacterium]|nr:hypothetical protein [Pseudomonadales bacterium]MBH2075411.1 hypothetical protein [Pseudomonadales bacterium]